MIDRTKKNPSKGTILLIHGSAPFNIDGRIPIENSPRYSRIPFYRELAGSLNECRWDVARYSKPGVRDDGVDFRRYNQTDLQAILTQLRGIWKELPRDKPLIMFAWSEGTLHATQLPLSEANALILLGGISTNIRDVILAQAEIEGNTEEVEAQLKGLSSMRRDEMLGIDRPVGRLLDELSMKDNWKYLEPFPRLPVLILHGEMDNEVPLDQARVWGTKLPWHKITLRVKPLGNHMFGIGDSADPNGLAQVIDRWLTEVLNQS